MGSEMAMRMARGGWSDAGGGGGGNEGWVVGGGEA